MPKRAQPLMRVSKRLAEIEEHCIARRAGACARIGECQACSTIEQSLRTASWALARWPQLGKRRKT